MQAKRPIFEIVEANDRRTGKKRIQFLSLEFNNRHEKSTRANIPEVTNEANRFELRKI